MGMAGLKLECSFVTKLIGKHRFLISRRLSSRPKPGGQLPNCVPQIREAIIPSTVVPRFEKILWKECLARDEMLESRNRAITISDKLSVQKVQVMTESDPDVKTEKESPEPASARSRGKAYAGVFFAMVLGLLLGLGSFTFGYGKGASYLSNNPQTCVNCHVMQEHMDSWQNSSHHHVAVCNDCHLPHDYVGKWVTKADNGFFHSLAFTLQNYHDPIRIKPRNKTVTGHRPCSAAGSGRRGRNVMCALPFGCGPRVSGLNDHVV